MTQAERVRLDHFADALIVTSPQGQVLAWSGGAERTFGYTPDEAVGRALAALIYPLDAPQEPGWRQGALHETTVYEATRRRKDGSTLLVDATLRVVRGPGGEVEAVAIVERA